MVPAMSAPDIAAALGVKSRTKWRLLANPIALVRAVHHHIDVEVVGVGWVRARPQDCGEPSACGCPKCSERLVLVPRCGRIPAPFGPLDREHAFVREFEAGDVDRDPDPVCAELAALDTVAGPAFEARSGSDRRERRADLAEDEWRDQAGDPAAESFRKTARDDGPVR